MDKDTLMNQIEFAWARIEELEGTLEHADPEGKGYNGLIDAYVKELGTSKAKFIVGACKYFIDNKKNPLDE